MAEPSLRERALRHLARRDHSRAELARKLAAHGSADEIEAVITRMGELGLQSDTRYAETFVRGKAARFGLSRLRNELSRRGVDRELIDQAIAATLPGAPLAVPTDVADRAACEALVAATVARFGRVEAMTEGGEESEAAQMIRMGVAMGIDPDYVGELVREGIEEDWAYILTDTDFEPAIDMRFANIKAHFDKIRGRVPPRGAA